MWDTNGGIYLGFGTNATEDGFDTSYDNEPLRYSADRHVVTVGPNGSGKSRRVLLVNLAQLTGWSVVVVDPKGELCHMTQAWREAHGAPPIILNPFGVLGLPSHGHNPVAALDPASDDFPDDAMGLAESMIRIEGNEPHWPASAQDLVAGLIMAVRLSMPGTGSLEHVREYLSNDYDQLRDNIQMMIKLARAKNCPELEAKVARFATIDNDSRELAAILSTAQTQTRWLDSRPIKKDFAKGGMCQFSDLKRHPTSVFLTLPARRLGTHATWLRVMIASIIQTLMNDTKRSEVPVLLMLDEYPAIAAGGFPIIEKNMAMLRGYGIKLWTVWQDLAQAEKLYGRGYESFIANAGVLQSFAPQDAFTSEMLSKLMPLTVMRSEAETRSFSGGADPKQGGSSHSINTGEQAMPLMLPQHLRNMDDGFSILFSHKLKGPARTFFPYRVDGLDEVYERDPSNVKAAP